VPLVRARLGEHRERLGDEHASDQEQQKLGLEQDRDGAQGAPDRETAGVAHEYLGRMGVEPEKADGAAHQRGTEHRQLPRTGQIEEVEVGGGVHPPEQIGEHREAECRDSSESGREPVEPVREVHRVARPGDHQRDEDDEEPRGKVDDEVLEERQRGRGRREDIRGHHRPGQQQEPQQHTEAALADQLVLGNEPARLSLHDLQVVVDEPDAAHPERGDHRDQHEPVGQRSPEKGRDDGGEEDDEPAHRGRAALDLVARGSLGADHLPHLAGAQPRDDRRPGHERKQQCRDRGAGGSKGDVVEEVEEDEVLAERCEQVIEHQASVRTGARGRGGAEVYVRAPPRGMP
jgi:hypothetical protein